VDRLGRHQNYQTKQQRDYDDQLPLPHIPPEAFRLTCGYQPNAVGDGIERIVVARPHGRDIRWCSQVVVVGAEASWEDITPRLPGTARTDFDAFRVRGRRR
jgi:hypothetical protein